MKKIIFLCLLGLFSCDNAKQLKKESKNYITNFYFIKKENTVNPDQLVIECKINDTLIGFINKRMIDSVRIQSYFPVYEGKRKLLTKEYWLGEIKNDTLKVFLDMNLDFQLKMQSQYDSIKNTMKTRLFRTIFYVHGGKVCLLEMQKR